MPHSRAGSDAARRSRTTDDSTAPNGGIHLVSRNPSALGGPPALLPGRTLLVPTYAPSSVVTSGTVTPTGSPKISLRETPQVNSSNFRDFRVADLGLADDGIMEIRIAAMEMPGLRELVERYGSRKVLKGARIVGCTNVTVHSAVFIETLIALGAEVRWCANNIHSTEDHVAAALAESGVAIYAWRGQTERDFWWCLHQCIRKDEWVPNLIVDNGGHAIHVIHRDAEDLLPGIIGCVEEDITGMHRLYKLNHDHMLKCPAMNTCDTINKSEFDNKYRCREALLEAIKRATSITVGGKEVVVCGFGSRGKGCCQALRGCGARVIVTECDPICALQACMEGFPVQTLDDCVKNGDIFITATGGRRVICRRHMDKMKNGSIVCNIGHYDQEVDVQSLRTPELRWENVKDQVDQIIWPDGRCVFLLGEGRLVDMTCGNGHTPFVRSIAHTSQVLALIELISHPDKYRHQVYKFPRYLDEEVSRLHLSRLNAQLTVLSDEQAEYMGIHTKGPYKSDAYRY